MLFVHAGAFEDPMSPLSKAVRSSDNAALIISSCRLNCDCDVSAAMESMLGTLFFLEDSSSWCAAGVDGDSQKEGLRVCAEGLLSVCRRSVCSSGGWLGSGRVVRSFPL
jgi:hypothetical protein